jgi:hypothetical protein
MNRRALVPFVGFFVSASCGLVPSEGTPPPFPADGVGTFGEASPVEVCLGTARVVAPALATGATALCMPKGQTERDCASGADCEGIERCICGRCVVEPCQGAGSCDGQTVCRGRRCTTACGADGDCAPGERCVSGGCARACGADGDCHHGERCDSLDDVCAASLCGSGSTCGASSTCEAAAFVAELGEPALVGYEPPPLAFFELSRGGARSLHRAVLDAPARWRVDPEEPVLTLPDETRVGAPSVIRRGGRLELYAAVGDPPRIVRASSTDQGRTFSIDADPLLAASEPWENGAVGSPSAFDLDGATYLLYEGGARAGIGLAKLGPASAERIGKNPWLSPADVEDPVFWRSITEVGAPHAVVFRGAVRVFFTARGIEGFSATGPDGELPAEPNDSIGLAVSTDLETLALFPTGPMYARLVNLRAYLGEREAFTRPLSSGWEMLFVSSDASGEGVTGLYRSVSRGAAE